jgi:hypothetical protein
MVPLAVDVSLLRDAALNVVREYAPSGRNAGEAKRY